MKIFNINQIERIINTNCIISSEMKDKLDLWAKMYSGCAFWHEDAPSCGIEKTITGALSDPISEEIKITSNNEKLEEILKKIQLDVNTIIEYFVCFGGCVIRPIYSNSRLQYEIVQLGHYLPIAYDIDGSLTGAIITKRISENDKDFLFIEKHSYENKTHSVESKLYKLENGQIDKEVSLISCTQTENVTPSYSWENVERPFIIEFRNRETNRIDGSNVPCALISGIENLIKDADIEYSRLIWEMEAGKTRVFADADLFDKRQTKNGNDTVTHLDPNLRKLFVKLNGDGTEHEKITTFSPTLRTANHLEAFNEILRRIELALNIGKGTLSNMESVQMTATQFSGGKKAFYSKIDKYESELEQKYKECAYVFAYMLSAFEDIPFDDEIHIEYNDMTRKDPKELKLMAMQEVNSGIMSKAEYRMRFFGESEEEALSKIPEVPSTTSFF